MRRIYSLQDVEFVKSQWSPCDGKRPDQVSYLSEIVSKSRISICKMRYLRNDTSDHNSINFFQHKLPPQNPEKITSETTFGHSKIIFWPLQCIKREFSRSDLDKMLCFLHIPIRLLETISEKYDIGQAFFLHLGGLQEHCEIYYRERQIYLKCIIFMMNICVSICTFTLVYQYY